MISILIPVYNYPVYSLVKEVSHQSESLGIAYEILVCDDASTQYFEENQSLTSFPYTQYFEATENAGRTATRNYLAQKAKFAQLLFLDADVSPQQADFMNGWVTAMETPGTDLIFGGVEYSPNPPEKSKMLRWKYGKHRETQSVEKRKKNPYLSINSGCFCISKKSFMEVNQHMLQNQYGLDLLFKTILESKKLSVKHVHNPVIHHGLEDNPVFLEKALSAVKTLVELEKNEAISSSYTRLQQWYVTLQKYHLITLTHKLIKPFRKKIKKNLVSKNPSLRLFDAYRLQYYMELKNRG